LSIEPNHLHRAAEPTDRTEGRPRELQDTLNFYVFHPLARRMALLLADGPVTPNMVSGFGALLVVAAGLLYTQPGWAIAPFLGFALHLAWHVVDGADGDLARLTGRAGPHGELVDGICDYGSHIILYLLLGALLHDEIGAVGWLLLVGAGISRIVQANHYEVQRRQYQWWMYGVPWLRSSPNETAGRGLAAKLGAGYLGLARILAPHAIAADAAVAAAKREPREIDRVREAIRRHATPMLTNLAPLGANYRTIALGLSMLAGSPLYFLVYEVLVLNLVAMRSVWISKRSTLLMITELRHLVANARR
jgi:phosphatidylglycerophosphate synthase